MDYPNNDFPYEMYLNEVIIPLVKKENNKNMANNLFTVKNSGNNNNSNTLNKTDEYSKDNYSNNIENEKN